MPLTRRRFFTRSGSLAAGVAAAPAVLAGPARAASRTGQRPGRIIMVVSDGMSLSTLSLADQFALGSLGRHLEWANLWRDSRATTALMNMRSLNSLVTDSAAASSSWGGGSRVMNGSLNVLPDGRPLTPLATLFGQAGWKTGLVTTAEITHATPAGFAVNVTDRGQGQVIAEQYLARQLDLLLGGGADHFDPTSRDDRRDLFAAYAAAGYRVLRDRDALLAAPADGRCLGVFAAGHLPYSMDRATDARLARAVPTLAEMTRAALRRFEGAEHFLLQVEGARIDHAAHASDAAAAIHDQLALDEALREVLAFQRRHPDTLVVAATDHGNSNPGLNGLGGGYARSSQHFARLAAVRRSVPAMLTSLLQLSGGQPAGRRALPDGSMTDVWHIEPQHLVDVVGEGAGWSVPEPRAAHFAGFLAGKADPLFDQMISPVTQLGQLLANHVGIGWTGNSHTSDYVPLAALGPGAGRFRGFVDNTDVFTHFTALAGIDHRNPAAPLIAESGPSASEAERWRWA
ncbi:MAG: alkaline phosphatase [Limisphaerales bacterium]